MSESAPIPPGGASWVEDTTEAERTAQTDELTRQIATLTAWAEVTVCLNAHRMDDTIGVLEVSVLQAPWCSVPPSALAEALRRAADQVAQWET